MRRAFELAYSNAYIFGGSRPIFVELDEVSFTSPVDIGDLLVFNSCVLYTESNVNMTSYFAKDNNVCNGKDIMLPLLHIEVECWVTEPEKASAKLSNLFCFTFAVSQSEAMPERRIRRVLPSNIDEARRIAKRISADIEQRLL
jgi:acyl-coenzyme A thioesterase 9